MVLNSSRLMPRLSCWYCGMVLYLANSACQSASESGGKTPVTGFHSTIDGPDSVSRVTPPTSTIANTSAAKHPSHTPTAPAPDGGGLCVLAAAPNGDTSDSAPAHIPEIIDGCHRTFMEPITPLLRDATALTIVDQLETRGIGWKETAASRSSMLRSTIRLSTSTVSQSTRRISPREPFDQ